MVEVRSCGVIVFRRAPSPEFLLMKHLSRWDLPKGHVEPGESDVDCALRELFEETGISADSIQLDPEFRYVTQYPVRDRRHPEQTALKTLIIFLGWLQRDVPIKLTEHVGYEWFSWPPQQVQAQTIDPLLAEVEKHLAAIQRRSARKKP